MWRCRGVSAALLAAAMFAAAGSGLAQDPGRGEQTEPDAQAPGRAEQAEPGASERGSQAPGAQAPPAAQGGDAGAQSNDAGSPSNAAGSESNAAAADKPYTVECRPDPEEGGNVCYVDRATYVGWRTFHSVCHTCHAQDAVGSTFAPNLLERMKVIDKATFLMVLDQGFEGQVGVMPAWGNNPNVNKYYEELWSYLRARSDGALLPGRPKRLPESK